ncbi:hypothetical protein B9Z19DRAFT_1118490 [Tuber borchii]|uniref:Uncharacterized protein n=1 Tax=Tuber borchii TaxID=42251 RepID=A0A2T7A8A3_TUBBO|nr:hypothetical protein B9Z19DRAFT_1118490 [Tuber borchii]
MQDVFPALRLTEANRAGSALLLDEFLCYKLCLEHERQELYPFAEREDKAGVRKPPNRIADAADREPSRDAVETQHPAVVKALVDCGVHLEFWGCLGDLLGVAASCGWADTLPLPLAGERLDTNERHYKDEALLHRYAAGWRYAEVVFAFGYG